MMKHRTKVIITRFVIAFALITAVLIYNLHVAATEISELNIRITALEELIYDNK
jgi:hypothetical protein